MVEFIGILKVKVIRGTNLAIRDLRSSDPYVILTLGQQVLQVPLFSVYLFQMVLESACSFD
jgi:stromal membrane-associated protein